MTTVADPSAPAAAPQPPAPPPVDDGAAAAETPPSDLRQNRDFRVLLGGQSVSAVGDAVSATAMPLLVLALTGSGALMGIVGALQFLPDLLLGLPAGALADRWDRRRMMMWADVGRAVLTALIPLSFWLGLPTMVVILVVTVPINAFRVLWMAGFTGAVPNLVGRQNLGRANSYIEAIFSGGFIIGPPIAGVLAATLGPATTLAIDAGSFIVSAASLALIRRSLRADRPGAPPHILEDIREGVRFLWRNTVLRLTVSFWSVVTVTTAALINALTYYIVIDRGYSELVLGFVSGAFGLGYLGGSLLGGRMGRRRVGMRMVAGTLVTGTLLVVLALVDAPAVYLVGAFVAGVAQGVVLVSYVTLRASLTPDQLLGRIGSTARTISLGLMPLGMLAGGALIEAGNGGVTLTAMGAIAIGASIMFGLSRTFRDAGH
jgi:MFS family permease